MGIEFVVKGEGLVFIIRLGSIMLFDFGFYDSVGYFGLLCSFRRSFKILRCA